MYFASVRIDNHENKIDVIQQLWKYTYVCLKFQIFVSYFKYYQKKKFNDLWGKTLTNSFHDSHALRNIKIFKNISSLNAKPLSTKCQFICKLPQGVKKERVFWWKNLIKFINILSLNIDLLCFNGSFAWPSFAWS